MAQVSRIAPDWNMKTEALSSDDMSGVHVVDAVHRVGRVERLDGKYAVARLVHVVDEGPGGHRYLLANTKCLASHRRARRNREDPKLLEGRAFQLTTKQVTEATGPVDLLGWSGRIPVITPTNLTDCLDRRRRAEDKLRDDIETATAEGEPPSEKPYGDEEKNRRDGDFLPVRVVVYNVGQADTIVVQFGKGPVWLVDAFFWREDSRNRFVEWLQDWSGRQTIERFIVSHLHYDHIRSAEPLIRRLNPREVILAGTAKHHTGTARNLLRYCSSKSKYRPLHGERRLRYGLADVHLLSTRNLLGRTPSGTNANNHGVVVWISTHRSVAVLPGDVPGNYLNRLAQRQDFAAACGEKEKRLYKVTHHGSKTGIAGDFLRLLSPTAAATSCGHGNRWDFPNNPPEDDIIASTGPFFGEEGYGVTRLNGNLEYSLT